MVSLIKKIADDPNYVEVSNVSPFINSDSIFCCTCDTECLFPDAERLLSHAVLLL